MGAAMGMGAARWVRVSGCFLPVGRRSGGGCRMGFGDDFLVKRYAAGREEGRGEGEGKRGEG